MINFRYVGLKTDKKTKPLSKQVFEAIITDAYVQSHCLAAREANKKGDKEAYENNKGQLPMIFWCGYNLKGERAKECLTPTQHFIIDIDHAKIEASQIWQNMCVDMAQDGVSKDKIVDAYGIRLVHETPSGGLRLVVRAKKPFQTIEEHQKDFTEAFRLADYGDVDTVVKDLSRGSFMVCQEWILFQDANLFDPNQTEDGPITAEANGGANSSPEAADDKDDKKSNAEKSKTPAKVMLPEITDEENNFCFEGKRVAEIANEYIIDQGGIPEEGLRHGFYNELIKNFRNICNNDPRIVFAVLPLCGGSAEKRWSQCTSICKANNTTRLPKDFYFWMVKRGYIASKKYSNVREYMESEEEPQAPVPQLPPVFREFCSICPPDFVYPTIVALLPVMGTLTSYVRADYIDFSEQSTTFFSCVWAPPSSGKGFAKRIVEMLMKKIRLRDEMNNLREQLWLVDTRTKSDNEKGVDLPHVMVRIMPAINSLPEFLEKMRDNRGYHMFTFAEEVDTFKKGSSSGGADKSDLFRTAWDNSEYGQSFKSANTFKGMVKVYYNILLTGTPGAVKKYYSNVEDGMVTRVSITEIENQQFAKFVPWKQLTKRQIEVIDKFVQRCDDNTYRDPVEMTEEEIQLYNTTSENYDKNVKWKFNLREKQKIDMSWLYPTILSWLEKTRVEASLDNDVAADVFRRRAAVKGFRLGLLCHCCWAQVRDKEKKVICKFVEWFMTRDLSESLKMFGAAYNKMNAEAYTEAVRHQGLYDSLSDTFSKNDVIAQCMKQGIHSRVRQIIYRWVRDKVIVKTAKEEYKKVKKNEKPN